MEWDPEDYVDDLVSRASAGSKPSRCRRRTRPRCMSCVRSWTACGPRSASASALALGDLTADELDAWVRPEDMVGG